MTRDHRQAPLKKVVVGVRDAQKAGFGQDGFHRPPGIHDRLSRPFRILGNPPDDAVMLTMLRMSIVRIPGKLLDLAR
jgi:hypothetical protein